jgi:hypothetical protein
MSRYQLDLSKTSASFRRANPNLAGNSPRTAETTPAPVSGGVRGKSAAKRQEMNKTEAAFFRTVLRRLEENGVAARIKWQPIRIYLNSGCSYRPDFCVWEKCGSRRFYEVKGPHVYSRDSAVLFKQAATENPEDRFFWAQWDGSKWNIRERTGAEWREVPT